MVRSQIEAIARKLAKPEDREAAHKLVKAAADELVKRALAGTDNARRRWYARALREVAVQVAWLCDDIAPPPAKSEAPSTKEEKKS